LKHVLPLQLGILADDVVGCIPVAEELQDEVHGDAHAANRGLTVANTGVDPDAIEHEVSLGEAEGFQRPERDRSYSLESMVRRFVKAPVLAYKPRRAARRTPRLRPSSSGGMR